MLSPRVLEFKDMSCNIQNRTIFCHDNLAILQGINSNSIDLIYLDPPFNKKKVFTAPIGSSAEGAEFSDIFREKDVKEEWLKTIKEDHDEIYGFLTGIKNYGNKYNFCYLAYMAIRLIECHRVLKETGSLYLHCDSTMSHYLKILLDCIFGEENFKNEIVWHYYNGATSSNMFFGRKHDIILFYTKNKNVCFSQIIREPHNKNSGWVKYKQKNKSNKIYGVPNPEGKRVHDVWRIPSINNMAKERIGYPTQKPLALLERIIKASSREGDIVLDPFCGCATTCVASEKLGRQWVGIDISIKAYDLVKLRLEREVKGLEDIKQKSGDIKTQTDIFRNELEVFAKMKPPKRTDIKKDYADKKYVYIISNTAYKDEYKVGIAKDYKSRLNSYQTSDPNRGYKIEFTLLTHKYRETEKHIHKNFDSRREWVRAELPKIKKEIKSYARKAG